MDKEAQHRLLYRFVGDRDNMNRPFNQNILINGVMGRYIVATDAYLVILIPETSENKRPDWDNHKAPNVNAIIGNFETETPIDIDYNNLLALYKGVEDVERFLISECDSCDGEGKFEHYGEWYDCKKCKEKGVVESTMKVKMKNPETLFKFKNTYIKIEKLSRLFEITIKKDVFEFKVMSSTSLLWLKIDDIYFAIAGVGYEKNSEDFKNYKTIEIC
jgi:hypothetical protein